MSSRGAGSWVVTSLLIGAAVPAAAAPTGPEAAAEAARVRILSGFISPLAADRVQAAEAAGADGAPVFIGPLLARITDPDPQVRAAVATAFGEIGIPPSSVDLDAMTRALTRAAKDPDRRVAPAALLALARFPFPEVQRTLARAARAKASTAERRAWAAAARRGVDPKEAQARLTAYFALTQAEAARSDEGPPGPELRWGVRPGSLLAAARDLLSVSGSLHWGATQVLASHEDVDARFPFLVHALREPSPPIRRLAAGALAKQGDARASRALVPSLPDPDPQVRAAALAGVARRADAASASQLVARLAEEPDPELRARIIELLETQPEPPTLAALSRWPAVVSADVALRGVEVLGARTSTAATRGLVGFVSKTTHRAVSQRAVAHLAERPDRQVVPSVLPAIVAADLGSPARMWLCPLLTMRRHPEIAPTLLDIIAAGRAGPSVERVLSLQPEELVRPRVLALLPNEDPRVRGSALRLAQGYRGPDALEAAAAAVDVAPDDNRAFALLDAQAPEALLPVRLRLLGDSTHRRRHPGLLTALADTRDPRIPASVASAVLTRPELAEPAIALLVQQPAAPAADGLLEIAGASAVQPEARAAAIRAATQLARTPGPPDEPLLDEDRVEVGLIPLAKDEALPVRYAARNALHRLHPTRYPSWDPYGRIPLIVEGAAFGAGLMVMATQIADADLSPAFVGGAGAVLGGATPFLLTLSEDVTLGDAGFFGTYGLWGTGAGYGLGLALDAERTDRLWLTVGGEALGVTAGALALQGLDWGLDDVAFANFTALQTSVLGAGITALILDGDARRNQTALGVGLMSGAASLVPLAFLTRGADVEDDIGLLSTAMAHGAWLGAVAPGLFYSDGLDAKRMAVGAAVGQSAGYLSGLVWGRFEDLRPADAGWSFFGATIGGAALGGLGLMLDDADPRVRFGLLEAGGAAGALTLGLLGQRLELRDNDLWLIGLSAAAGALAGSDLSVRLEEGTTGEPGFAGGLLMGAGFGTAAGLLASQYVDVSDKTLLYTVLGAGIGAAAGTGLGRMAPDLDVRDRSRISSVFTVAALGLALPWAENLDLSGRTVGYGLASGGVLGGLMALTPYYYADGAPPAGQVASGALFGAALGTYAGIGVAQALELELRQTGQVMLASVAAAGFGGGLGLVIPETDDAVSVGLAQGLGLATFATTSGLAAAGVFGKARGRRSGARGGTVLRMSSLGLHGALHGALIPLTWRADGDEVPGREIGGGLMLGTSAGILLGLGARGLGAPRLTSPDLLETSLLTSTMYAVGGGVGLAAQDRRLGMSLVHGLGVPAYAAAWLLSPHTEYDEGTPWTLTLGTGAGGWLGGWAARLAIEDPEAGQIAGGALAGAGLGAAAGALWTQVQTDRQEGEILVDTALGATLGGGIALAADLDGRAGAAAIEAGTALGLGLGIALAPRTTFDPGDRGLLGVSTSLGALHGAFVPTMFDETSARSRGGAALIGTAAGFAAGSVAAQFTDLDPKEVVELSMIVAGADVLGGGLALSIGSIDGATRSGILHAAGAAGLVAGALVAPHTRYELDDASLMSLTGVFGGVAGMMLPGLWNDDVGARERAGGLMMGASAGTLAGLVLSQTYRLDVGDQLEAGLTGTMGVGLGAGLAHLLDVDGDARAALVAGSAVAGLAAGIAAAPHTSLTAADRRLLGYSTSMGAWHGLWLPSLWGDDSGTSRAAGLALGVGAGWVAGMVGGQFTEVESAALVEGSLLWGIGAGIGGGVGLLLPEVSGGATAGLMEGLGAAGAISGLVFSEALTLEGGDYALVPAGTLFGAALGLTLPAFVSEDSGSAEVRGGGVLLGASAGALVAGTVAQFAAPDFDDVLEASMMSVISQGFGFGLGLMIPDSSEAARFALLDGFGVAGLGAGLWLAQHTDFDNESAAALAMGAALGAGLGALTPSYYNGGKVSDAPSEQIGGGALLGATAGFATAVVLDQVFDMSSTTRNHAALGATLGGLTGGGLGLLFSRDDRVATSLTQGLAAAGAGVLGTTLRDFDYTGGDLALGSAYVGYLTWHGMGLTLLLDGTNRQAAGVAVGTVGLGALTGMYLAPYIDMTLSDTLMLLAGNVWGTWIGGWGGALLADAVGSDLDGRRQVGLTLLSTVLGSDIGLAVTGMVVGGLLDVPPTQFAFINLGGLGGMLIGMLGAGFADGEPLKAGNVIGSLSGLVLGAVITSFFDWSSSPTWDELLSRRAPQLDPALAKKDDLPKPQGPTGFGIEQWMPSAQVAPSPEGEPVYLFTLSGTFR